MSLADEVDLLHPAGSATYCSKLASVRDAVCQWFFAWPLSKWFFRLAR
jgi:hypothetical protein